jgi:hypothetical protein
MREKAWLACKDPEPMIAFLGARVSDRQLRLFALACVRRAWQFVTDKRIPALVAILEDVAEGKVKSREREKARNRSYTIATSDLDDMQQCIGYDLWTAFEKDQDRENNDLGECVAAAFGYFKQGDTTHNRKFVAGKKAERAQQPAVLREIVGNPFRMVKFDPKWRTDTARALARQMYDSQQFAAAPILADALQDAGCECEPLLNHLRDSAATHVRGCWAVDLVLGLS